VSRAVRLAAAVAIHESADALTRACEAFTQRRERPAIMKRDPKDRQSGKAKNA